MPQSNRDRVEKPDISLAYRGGVANRAGERDADFPHLEALMAAAAVNRGFYKALARLCRKEGTERAGCVN